MEAPYAVSLDPDTALALTREGGILLLLDLQPGTYLGLDQQVYETGPSFKGVKMVPPGPHFLCHCGHAAADKVADFQSAFVWVDARSVLVRRWDAQQEALVELEEDEANRYALGARNFDFDLGLAPYNLSMYRQWQQLTHYVTAEVIRETMPVCGRLSALSECGELMEPRTDAEHRLKEQLTVGRQRQVARQGPGEGSGSEARDVHAAGAAEAGSRTVGHGDGGASSRCRYSEVPRHAAHAHGLRGAELSAACLDRSGELAELLAAPRFSGRSARLLGELQFTFVAATYGRSLQGFQQWKSLLLLLLSCEAAALHTHTQLLCELLKLLQVQLQAATSRSSSASSAGLFSMEEVDDNLSGSFLHAATGWFLEVVDDAGGAAPDSLFREASGLRQFLTSTLGWMFLTGDGTGDGADDEYAPVVVEL